MVPCDLGCHDERVVVLDCDSNGEFSVDQSNHFGANGSDDRHSWRERERKKEKESESSLPQVKTIKVTIFVGTNV